MSQPQSQSHSTISAPAGAISVSHRDLPLSCPPPDAPVWNQHPRVFLPIEDAPNGEAVCPYCGAHYVLTV
ncbi:zinc-finger domain-containing protein [Chromatium okenii]|uniref:zinc-finger domain-containing protein n=1 Tax=Chromatium okenii TaxID=61644 RepID=UPI0026EF6074|nr:zinc-finger domain-containing protein [Chromatium okenii]MBV5309106.1 zinc-finger domain-containing protein [Chromatium okenii]